MNGNQSYKSQTAGDAAKVINNQSLCFSNIRGTACTFLWECQDTLFPVKTKLKTDLEKHNWKHCCTYRNNNAAIGITELIIC